MYLNMHAGPCTPHCPETVDIDCVKEVGWAGVEGECFYFIPYEVMFGLVF